MRRFFRYPFVLSVCLLLAAPAVFAQTTGDIQGAVTDADGKPLPGVTVEATSSANLRSSRSHSGSPVGISEGNTPVA